ncbi:MAG: AMP-binding protein [Gammaproteobacteria bacterium]|nr:MAG: AMP-binding protein [Gammaproteobacteria bacterium]
MIKQLHQLFTSPQTARDYDQIIAFDDLSSTSWSDLWKRVAVWQAALMKIDGDLVALYQRDSIEFLAALFALWRLGKQALVPANNLATSCQQLAQLTPYFAGEFNIVNVINPVSDENVTDPLKLAESKTSDIHACALVLFTSGSTSQPTPIPKSFAQLDAEISALESVWGGTIAGASISSTVSHHHIYGLLFRLLWPLCSGRPFVRNERDYWEELVRDAQTRLPLVVVSSPAHLSRIPPLAWPEKALIAVFCSGAPLATQSALAAKSQLGHVITEVYGSTETGGIAWREQDKNSAWTCLPGVEINLTQESSLLQVRSPHLADRSWFTSADQVTLNEDGRFNLCGRADRIAKVGGKRISLSAIERLLEQQEGVAEARVILLPERGDRLGAVVILNNDGNKRLVDQGKSAINQQLKQALENKVDRIAIPRYWRYLGELPQNRQGKTTLADLMALFATEPLPRLPVLIGKQEAQDSLTMELFVPANLYYFDGHFPGRPVLPGVVQTHWAIHYAREQWGDLGEFTGLEAVKFQRVITANQTLLLRLEYHQDKDKLYFSYISNNDQAIPHASGRVAFSRGPTNG